MNAFEKYCALLYALDVLDAAGLIESLPADALRDSANVAWLGLGDDERELFAKTPVDSCVGDQAEVKSLWPEYLTQLCDEAKKEKPLP